MRTLGPVLPPHCIAGSRLVPDNSLTVDVRPAPFLAETDRGNAYNYRTADNCVGVVGVAPCIVPMKPIHAILDQVGEYQKFGRSGESLGFVSHQQPRAVTPVTKRCQKLSECSPIRIAQTMQVVGQPSMSRSISAACNIIYVEKIEHTPVERVPGKSSYPHFREQISEARRVTTVEEISRVVERRVQKPVEETVEKRAERVFQKPVYVRSPSPNILERPAMPESLVDSSEGTNGIGEVPFSISAEDPRIVEMRVDHITEALLEKPVEGAAENLVHKDSAVPCSAALPLVAYPFCPAGVDIAKLSPLLEERECRATGQTYHHGVPTLELGQSTRDSAMTVAENQPNHDLTDRMQSAELELERIITALSASSRKALDGRLIENILERLCDVNAPPNSQATEQSESHIAECSVSKIEDAENQIQRLSDALGIPRELSLQPSKSKSQFEDSIDRIQAAENECRRLADALDTPRMQCSLQTGYITPNIQSARPSLDASPRRRAAPESVLAPSLRLSLTSVQSTPRILSARSSFLCTPRTHSPRSEMRATPRIRSARSEYPGAPRIQSARSELHTKPRLMALDQIEVAENELQRIADVLAKPRLQSVPPSPCSLSRVLDIHS